MSKMQLMNGLVVGLAIAALAGCGGKHALMPKETPAWVVKGSGAFKDSGQNFGLAAAISTVIFLMVAALSLANLKLARVHKE